MSAKNNKTMPSNLNASSCGCGSARKNYVRENYSARQYGNGGCVFPKPAPKMCYCHPAPFATVDGSNYHRLYDGYGHSTEC